MATPHTPDGSSSSSSSSRGASVDVVWGPVNTRVFLEKFYTVHNPEKLSTIDLILERYRGHEGELFAHLSEKYDVAEFFAEAGIELAEAEGEEEDVDVDDDDGGEEEVEGGDDGDEDGEEGSSHDYRNNNNPVASSVDSTASVSSTRHPNGTTSHSMVQDLSSRLGFGGGITGTSMTPQSHHMRQRHAASSGATEQERQQLLTTLQTLKSQVASLKRDNDSVRNNLVAVVDKETNLSRELQAAGEQAKALERSRHELKTQLRTALGQRDSKHAQLEEAVLLNHRLGSQVRYLASKAFETMDGGDIAGGLAPSSSGAGAGAGAGGSGGSSASDGSSTKRMLHLPEFSSLEKKISEGVKSVCDAELKAVFHRLAAKGININVDDTDAGLPEDAASNNDKPDESLEHITDNSSYTILKQRVLLAAQARTIEVLQTLYLASRIEMRLSTRQNGLCEQRIAEQQLVVEGLQNKLAGIANELDTASGSADHMRRQINETSSDLASHKLMLAMAERTAKSRGTELAEARDEIASLQDALAASAAARQDLVQLCAMHTAGAEAKAAEFVRGLSERVLLEREEFISRWSGMQALDREARSANAIGMQIEMQKLREELLKARSQAGQRDREVAFLQRQLQEAAERIASLPAR